MQFSKTTAALAASVAMLSCVLLVPATAQTTGFVYVATNQPAGNQIIQYRRATTGLLTKLSQVLTGGKGGTGNGVGNLDPLGSQDSLLLNDTGSLLLAVNAGSNQVSSVAVTATGLRLVSTISSGGSFPNSVALSGTLVYVLNAHGTPNVTGFRIAANGELQNIPGSTRNLPGGSTAAPHDIRFTPDNTRLIVTEGGTNQIDIFELGNNGLITKVATQPSAGSGPFGFRFGRQGVLLNTEANTASLSSYTVTTLDTLAVLSAAVPDTQKAACWITLTGTARIGFISNTASGTLSSYEIDSNGAVALQKTVAGSLGSGAPIDSARSVDSQYLYVDDSALGRIVIFKISGSSLSPVGSVTGLPTTLQGIAAQ
jgi:6-phosphogluconolactonase (cycloisomerase 2 family)